MRLVLEHQDQHDAHRAAMESMDDKHKARPDDPERLPAPTVM
ncbi:MAG: hypothetical protein ACE5IK_00365 [Acidobacteriota bacterium]